MTKRTALASLFALALALAAGAAQAQAPRDGSSAVDGNVVGGGVATLSGGGDNATVTYSAGTDAPIEVKRPFARGRLLLWARGRDSRRSRAPRSA
jgi:hypothetical protein